MPSNAVVLCVRYLLRRCNTCARRSQSDVGPGTQTAPPTGYGALGLRKTGAGSAAAFAACRQAGAVGGSGLVGAGGLGSELANCDALAGMPQEHSRRCAGPIQLGGCRHPGWIDSHNQRRAQAQGMVAI